MKKITSNKRYYVIDQGKEQNCFQWMIGITYGAIFLVSLWIRLGFPTFAIADSVFDDLLFQKLARHLLYSDWLGPYDKLTLAKGMFYPFFISISAFIGLPLKIAEHILYLGCCFFAARYASRVARSAILGIILYAFLAFNPVFWTESLARVIREGIYISLSMILIVSIVATLFPFKINSSNKWAFLKPLAIGVIGGCYWLTREEGIWLAPTILLVIIIAFITQWKKDKFIKAISGDFIKTLIVGALAFCVVVGSVRFENWRHYQIFETTEFHSYSFLNAYGALARIKQDSPKRYVVFPEDARKRAYSVSEAARELAPYLEGESGYFWKLTSHSQIPDSSEIGAGWFMWALRDSVSLAGHYKSGEDAMKFYDRLAKEVNTACDEKKIECLSARSTQAPVFKKHYIYDAIIASKALLPYFLTLNENPIHIGSGIQPSLGTDLEINEISDLVGEVSLNKNFNSHFYGWIAEKDRLPEISIASNQENYNTKIIYSDAADVKAAYPGLLAARFEGDVGCEKICDIKIRIHKGDLSYDLALKNGTLLDTPDVKVYIDHATHSELNSIKMKRVNLQLTVANNIALFYGKLMPYLFFMGMLGFLWSLIRYLRSRQATPIFVICFASLTAILTRLSLLAYLQVTSIPSLNILYASPASSFVVIFSVTGCYLLLMAFGKKYHSPSS
ncbi:hypothetical protein [Acerihabitans arboris]|uniref:Uncharacterized protein n=1 Tax=Acerihabitans arboris TaxID=2691583 RepID=A0A845SHE5_9GAMM|nr:hypothetical protein [Acerihabitans arboris]NDL62098.1 hypothetical protein [Acerihabitans arboris]